MKAQGFGDVPSHPLAQRVALTGKARMTDEEFLQQFGYGISTLFGRGAPESDLNERSARAWPGRPGGLLSGAVRRQRWPDLRRGHSHRRHDRARRLHEPGHRAVFVGAAVLATLQGKFDDLRSAWRRTSAWSGWWKRSAGVWGGERIPLGARADRRRPDQALQGHRRVGTQPGATVPADARRPTTGVRSRA